ncbi:MAG: Rpn family recombination-promoting nuclease/putative transposase [Holosporaceae bacterium]|jgi:predicted transposase/invertase (TIGR01784 family)|nr:Rpn family recombination-promoting nuclease/putative transposase [Holosporaceae bacterium]
MEQEILPKDDIMFRMIFGNPKHSRILIHFLNCVIKPETPIKSVKIEKTELTPEYAAQKGVRLDIVAVTDSGEILNIEMQRKDEKNITARALFYWSQLFAGQLEIGEKYHQLKRTISINILDFDLFKNDERYWRKGYLKDDVSNEKFTDLLEMHFLELGKMRQVEEESPVTFWIEFFKNPYSEKIASLCKFVPEIQEAKTVFEKAKSDPEARELMRIREKGLRDYYNDISCAMDEGREEGELKKARETALTMLVDGVPVATVGRYTGLSIEEIESLRNKQ